MAANTTVQRLGLLARITEDPNPARLTRSFLSPAMREATSLVGGWMQSAGLQVFEDQAGNLIGRLESLYPDAKSLLLGSHLDTVRDAGPYDGTLGVLAALEAVERLRESGDSLPFHLDIVAFSDEEGVRFHNTYLGSRHLIGALTETELAVRDPAGTTVGDAIAAHRPRFPAPPPFDVATVIGFVEAHIEQGPILEAQNLALGVVSAISGQTRARVRIRGKRGHAGTVPMGMRADALAAAAAAISAIEACARKRPDAVATVGVLTVDEPASNTIPGDVTFTLDVRHPDDDKRRALLEAIRADLPPIFDGRGVTGELTVVQDTAAVACDLALTQHLQSAVAAHQFEGCPVLHSGAGHDAVALSAAVPVAMLFVRCRDGLSHHPDEYASPEDIELAVETLATFLSDLPAPC